jgi:hypothetical protein
MLAAAFWGLLTAGSLWVGAALAAARPGLSWVGLALAFGSGALIAAIAYELVLEAYETDLAFAASGFAAGALTFYVGDLLIDRRGGHGRKSMKGDAQLAGSASAIVFGTILDGIPESFVLGGSRAIRANMSTIGAAGGSIIAAIVVTQTPRYQPSAPRSAPGPMSIPRMRSMVMIQVTSARPSSRAASPIGLTRTAPGRRPRGAGSAVPPNSVDPPSCTLQPSATDRRTRRALQPYSTRSARTRCRCSPGTPSTSRSRPA